MVEGQMQDRDIATKVESLNLDPILYSLVKKPDGPQWTLLRAKKAEKWYKRFLFLIAKYPDEAIVPTKEVDEVWHTHILDTQKYFQDCGAVFGEYLHHFPYLGTRGEQDRHDLEAAFFRTLALFEFHFNETPLDSLKSSRSAICSSCSSSCSKSSARSGKGVDLSVRPSVSV
jgi:hypothetical protein